MLLSIEEVMHEYIEKGKRCSKQGLSCSRLDSEQILFFSGRGELLNQCKMVKLYLMQGGFLVRETRLLSVFEPHYRYNIIFHEGSEKFTGDILDALQVFSLS